MSTEQHSALCPVDGQSRTIPVLCRYRSGFNATVQVSCDGRTRVVAYHCPPMPACIFWNTTTQAFSSRGCSTQAIAKSDRAVECSCTHLTTFSTAPDYLLSSALSAWAGLHSIPEPDHSGGLMAVVGILYASLLAALVLTRCRRVHQSYAFLKYVIPHCVFSHSLHNLPPIECFDAPAILIVLWQPRAVHSHVPYPHEEHSEEG